MHNSMLLQLQRIQRFDYNENDNNDKNSMVGTD